MQTEQRYIVRAVNPNTGRYVYWSANGWTDDTSAREYFTGKQSQAFDISRLGELVGVARWVPVY